MAARMMLLDRVIPCAHQLFLNRSFGNLQLKVRGNFVRGNFVREFCSAPSHHHQQQQLSDDDNHDGLIDYADYNRARRALELQQQPSCDDDFLGANKLGKKFLIRRSSSSSFMDDDGDDDDGKQQLQLEHVPVESLRGKIVCLYLEKSLQSYPPSPSPEIRVRCDIREFYNTLRLTKPDSFEMIYVPPMPPNEDEEEDPSVHSAVTSTLPWLSLPLGDLHWRSYLRRVYKGYPEYTGIVFIDTRGNKAELLPSHLVEMKIDVYGPHCYPFTKERLQQLEAQYQEFGKETSIQAILGSSSRDYLIDRHSNKVPISSLQDKNVLLFGYSGVDFYDEVCSLERRLVEIYNESHDDSFEIVSINFDHNGGNKKIEKSWKDHLARVPWLSLPFGDEKIWPLRAMVSNVLAEWGCPYLLVKPKGKSLLDPYGYQVLQAFGNQAFPFSRRAAAEYLVTSAKGLSFKSYVDEASRAAGLDFNCLIRNKPEGGTEHVSLSTILEEKPRGILILFASLETCSEKRLKSLISVYHNSQKESSSFEVIFVSIDKDTPSFSEHFSMMPWFAFPRPINRFEHGTLAKNTTNIGVNGYSHFVAFGPDQLLLQVGLLTKSFENLEFPFVDDSESADHVSFLLREGLDAQLEADGTSSHEGEGWWEGIQYKCVPGIDGSCYSDCDDRFY